MKFTNVVIAMVMAGVLSVCISTQVFYVSRLGNKVSEIRNKAVMQRFISESFRNTCNGKGFKDLIQWQVTCRAMFNLSYIAWSDASEFMEVPEDICNKKLFYGKWINSDGEGEVYCRDRTKFVEE